jgi:hypothetical protein
MDDKKQIKIRFTVEEAEAIARAVNQQPGESLTAALKKYFDNRGRKEARDHDSEKHTTRL